MTSLHQKHCAPCEGGVTPLTQDEAKKLLASLDKWNLDSDGKSIGKYYTFKNYYHTMAFVNAVAFLSHREDHHPDLVVAYNSCRVTYTTHAIQGLSDNDFICAAKIDKLEHI